MSEGLVHPLPAFPRRAHLLAGALALTLLVIYGSFVPLEFKSLSWAQAVEQFKNVPYLDLSVYRRADWVANLVLFVPLGFLWLGAVDLDRRTRLKTWIALPIILAILVAVAIAMEFAQQWTVRRTVSQNDMLAESAGALLGVLAWLVIGRRFVSFIRGFTASPAIDKQTGLPSDGRGEGRNEVSPTRRLLQLYAIGFLLYSFQPFDFTFSPDEIGSQFRDQIQLKSGTTVEGRIVARDRFSVRIQPEGAGTTRTIGNASIQQVLPRKVLLKPFSHSFKNPFDAAWQLGSDVLLFIPFGMLLRYRRNVKRSFIKAVLLACAIAALIEFAQLFVFSRFLDTTDIFTSGFGAIIGAALAGRFTIGEPKPQHEQDEVGVGRIIAAIAMCLLYTAPLAIIVWHPYHRVPNMDVFWKQLGMMIDLPFKAYYYAGEFKAISNLMRNLMLFLPVGALLRWGFGSSLRNMAGKRVLVILVALAMGLVLETGKAAIVNKHADITDLMIYASGALIGWWLWGIVTRPRTTTHSESIESV